MKTIVVLLVLAVAGAALDAPRNTSLTRSFERANKVAGEQNADYHAEKPA